MLSYRTLRDLVNLIVRDEVTASGISFRLPAPVASCSAEDPLWRELKVSHPWMRVPREVLPGAKGVIVFALPISLETVMSNLMGEDPSFEWLRDYVAANEILWRVATRIASIFEDYGYKSIAMSPTHDFDEELRASWSHRHAGFLCGLGTFGLNNLLITTMGCAVRLNSVITEASVEEGPRPEFEYCLAKRGHKCDVCMRRCPIRALDDWSLRKRLCYENLVKSAERVGIGQADACGKCSTGVPCATRVP